MKILLLIAALFISPLWAAGAEECLECHEKYRNTDHGKQDCIACHTDAGQLPHAEKLLKPDVKTRGEFINNPGFKWIDFFGIFFSLLAMFFVCVHIILRLVFKR